MERPLKAKTPWQTPEPAPTAEAVRPLSPARAFVVQFREGTGRPETRFAGRAEHMISGQAARFESPEELVAFFVRTLSAVPAAKLAREP